MMDWNYSNALPQSGTPKLILSHPHGSSTNDGILSCQLPQCPADLPSTQAKGPQTRAHEPHATH